MREATVRPAAAYYIAQVQRKQAVGTYPLESTACFCGSTAGSPLVETDRYGFAHRMMLCGQCGVIYASPRMTAAAYRAFYEQEYRGIYDTPHAAATAWDEGVARGEALASVLHDRVDRPIHVVAELGCRDGAMLEAFRRRGCDTYGADYAPDRTHDAALLHGGLEQLEQVGRLADLFILEHVLEHCVDLPDTLTRIAALLAPKGLLYVGVPGLYAWDRASLFQNAHVWQFTGDTLAYVMECQGWHPVSLDERICSVWEWTGDCRDRSDRPWDAARQIRQYWTHGTRLLPEIRTVSKFPVQQRTAWMAASLAQQRPDVSAVRGTEAGREAIILGGGPSADQYVEQIRAWQATGTRLMAIERMVPWCRRHGLTPQYVVAMDASEDVVDAFTSCPSESLYLIATQCQPAVWARVADRQAYSFTTPQHGVDVEALWDAAGQAVATQVNSGGSVTLCAMSLAFLLGCRTLHVVGFDCHVTAGTYANGIAGVGTLEDTLEVSRVGSGLRYRTTSAYVSFAQQFFKLMQLAQACDLIERVTVYGDSLVALMHRPDGPLREVIAVQPHP